MMGRAVMIACVAVFTAPLASAGRTQPQFWPFTNGTSPESVQTNALPRQKIVISAATPKECRDKVSSEVRTRFIQEYGVQHTDVRRKDGEYCDFFRGASKTSFIPRFVLHGTSGVDPETKWSPPGIVNFKRLRSGFQTVAPASDADTSTHWTAAYAFEEQSSEFPDTVGYAGVFKVQGEGDACEEATCINEKGLSNRYVDMDITSCSGEMLAELEWGKNVVSTISQFRGDFDKDKNLCAIFLPDLQAENKEQDDSKSSVVTFAAHAKCEPILKEVYEVSCVRESAPIAVS